MITILHFPPLLTHHSLHYSFLLRKTNHLNHIVLGKISLVAHTHTISIVHHSYAVTSPPKSIHCQFPYHSHHPPHPLVIIPPVIMPSSNNRTVTLPDSSNAVIVLYPVPTLHTRPRSTRASALSASAKLSSLTPCYIFGTSCRFTRALRERSMQIGRKCYWEELAKFYDEWDHRLTVEVIPRPIRNGPKYALPLTKKNLNLLTVREYHKLGVICSSRGPFDDTWSSLMRIETDAVEFGLYNGRGPGYVIQPKVRNI
jgi:hypothetical protein